MMKAKQIIVLNASGGLYEEMNTKKFEPLRYFQLSECFYE